MHNLSLSDTERNALNIRDLYNMDQKQWTSLWATFMLLVKRMKRNPFAFTYESYRDITPENTKFIFELVQTFMEYTGNKYSFTFITNEEEGFYQLQFTLKDL